MTGGMILNGTVLGLPLVAYSDTKANIEALSGVAEGATAFSTDTHQKGRYDGSAWRWGLGLDSILVVAADGGDYTTITSALAAASAGDTILVMPGDYAESFTMVNQVSVIGLDWMRTKISGTVTFSGTTTEAVIKGFSVGDGAANPAISHTSSGTNYIFDCYVSGFSGIATAYGLNASAGTVWVSGSFLLASGNPLGIGLNMTGTSGVYLAESYANLITNASSGSVLNFNSGYGAVTGTINSTYFGLSVLDAIKNYDGSGSGLDADTLDSYEASTTPTVNEIPVVDGTGYLNFPGGVKTDKVDEYSAGLGVEVDGVILKDSAIWAENGIEVGSAASGKGTAGQVYVEESASNGAVRIGYDSPSNGIQVLSHQSAGGWARGYGIANTGATEIYMQFGTLGSGQTHTYSYIGAAYNQTALRLYKYDATTPSYAVFTDVNLCVMPAGETGSYPVTVKTSGAYDNEHVGVYVTQDYSTNDVTTYCYFGDFTQNNASRAFRGIFLRLASGVTYHSGIGAYISLEGTAGTDVLHGFYVNLASTASVATNFYGLTVLGVSGATVSGSAFLVYGNQAATVTSSNYGIYLTGVDRNYLAGVLGVGNADYTAGINVGTSGDAWTTSSWDKGLELQHGSVIKWKYNNNYAFGMGVAGTPAVQYFMYSTSDGTGTAVNYWMSYNVGNDIVTINAMVRGGGTSGHFEVETDYGTSQYGMLNSSYCHLYTDASVGFYFQKSITVNGPINAYGTTKTNDIGTSSVAWDDVWADDFQNVADFFWADEHRGQPVDDLAAIRQIGPSNVRDERTGMLLIDDDTLPAFMLTRAKDTGEVVYDPEGKPYLSLKMVTSVIMGAVRQLAGGQEDLWAAINELKGV